MKTDMIAAFKKAIRFDRIRKFNDVHDELGRFAEKGNGKSFASKRTEVLSMDDSDKAVWLIDEGAITEEEMLSRFQSGETDQAVNEYFDILDKNGDPTPSKKTSGQITLHPDTKDWTGARIEKLSELTGFDVEKSKSAKEAIDKYTSGALITDKEKHTIDEYIDKAPAYDSTIYRGMSFGDDYESFKARFSKGESFSLDEQISSWSSDKETARGFAHTNDDGVNSVFVTCVKNRTSTPIDYLNGQGEGEVLASSKAEWTVLHMEESETNDGHKKLFVTCVEKGERVAKSFLEIIGKKNPYHDKLGKFCSADQAANAVDLSKYGKMIRTKPAPEKTVTAYKAFIVKDGKLYPPMVANPDALDTPTGVWLDAQEGTRAGKSKTGRDQVKAGGKGTKGGSGTLAYRPGWHLGDIPLATQFYTTNKKTGEKETYSNLVFAECEIAADVDYQDEAMSYGYNKNGKFQHSLAGLPKIPEDGCYRYRTNPNPDTRAWYITGAMKVGKILTDEQCQEICSEAGENIMPRVGGELTKEKLLEMGIDESLIKD